MGMLSGNALQSRHCLHTSMDIWAHTHTHTHAMSLHVKRSMLSLHEGQRSWDSVRQPAKAV